MSDETKDICFSLPTLNFNSDPLVFIPGSYITAEHIEYMKSVGFFLERFGKERSVKRGAYIKNIQTDQYLCTIVIGSKGIAVIYSTPISRNESFKLNFEDFSGFGGCYDEMIERVLETCKKFSENLFYNIMANWLMPAMTLNIDQNPLFHKGTYLNDEHISFLNEQGFYIRSLSSSKGDRPEFVYTRVFDHKGPEGTKVIISVNSEVISIYFSNGEIMHNGFIVQYGNYDIHESFAKCFDEAVMFINSL